MKFLSWVHIIIMFYTFSQVFFILSFMLKIDFRSEHIAIYQIISSYAIIISRRSLPNKSACNHKCYIEFEADFWSSGSYW